MSVSADVAPYGVQPSAGVPFRLRPVQWAVDRHVQGRMGLAGRFFWGVLSPTYRSAVLLWDEVVEVEVRLLSRQAARLQAEVEMSRLVSEDAQRARRFWELVSPLRG